MAVEYLSPGLECVVTRGRSVCLSTVLETALLGSPASSPMSPKLGLNDESQLSHPERIPLPSPPVPLSSRDSWILKTATGLQG